MYLKNQILNLISLFIESNLFFFFYNNFFVKKNVNNTNNIVENFDISRFW